MFAIKFRGKTALPCGFLGAIYHCMVKKQTVGTFSNASVQNRLFSYYQSINTLYQINAFFSTIVSLFPYLPFFCGRNENCLLFGWCCRHFQAIANSIDFSCWTQCYL